MGGLGEREEETLRERRREEKKKNIKDTWIIKVGLSARKWDTIIGAEYD